MELRVRSTGEIITEREFKNIHKNTSFPKVLTPEILDDFGVDLILEGPQAQTNPPYEISVRQGIEKIDGKWFTKYVVGPIFADSDEKTAEEQEIEYKSRIDEQTAKSVRYQRDRLLSETDWIVIKANETGEELSTSFKEYRQALRDISLQDGFPHNIIWPENLS